MSSAFGGLFGGDDEPQSVSQSGFYALPRFARDAFETNVNNAVSLSRQSDLFAPSSITPEQQQALNILSQDVQPLTQDQFTDRVNVFYNPFVEQTLDPALADLQRSAQVALGDIGSGAGAAGGFGGTRQAVLESELLRNLAAESGRLSANVRASAFDSATQNALSQLARDQDREQLQAQNLFNAGEILRGIETQQQQAPLTAQQYLSSILGVFPQGQESTTTGGGQSGLSTISQGAQAALAVSQLFSDARLKTDIQFIRNEGDYNIYRFKYLGSEDVYEGVMADEVEEIKPEAVGEANGYKTVDYSMIPPDFRKVAS